ncbi:MAG: helix-turn-helix transcriptional regulator [Dehalococcoidia bacterium]
MERETLNLEEVAVKLGIGRGSAYQAAKDGTLPVKVIRVGRRIVVSRAALDALLAGGADDGGAR